MPVDPDDLAVAALGRSAHADDGLDADERESLEALRRVVSTGTAVTADDRAREQPPADLWSRIDSEALGRTTDTAPAPTAPQAEVTDLATRRAQRNRTLAIVGAVAAAAVLLAGVAGVLLSDQGSTEVVASTDLSLLAGGGTGSAELVERDDGLHLVVDVSDLAPAEQADFYELWMLAPDASDMASMTKFTASSGEIDVPVPDGVDPGAFPVVDISEEVDDGDDTHSGLSILRGELA